jgi:Glycosyl hydrolase family 47
MYIDPNSGLLLQSTVTLGARGDSLYEYLLKQFLLAGNRRHEKSGFVRFVPAPLSLPCLDWTLQDVGLRNVHQIRERHLVQVAAGDGRFVCSPDICVAELAYLFSTPRHPAMRMLPSNPKLPRRTMTCHQHCGIKWTI